MGVAIRDILSDYKTPVTWDSLPGVAAIDANNALYQFLTIIRQPDGTRAHLPQWMTLSSAGDVPTPLRFSEILFLALLVLLVAEGLVLATIERAIQGEPDLAS